MPKIIRLNDATSHGGKVVGVKATHFTIGGIPAARVGDTTTCPKHGPGTVVEGNGRHTVDGVAVAYEGHKTSCGATLIAGDPRTTCTA